MKFRDKDIQQEMSKNSGSSTFVVEEEERERQCNALINFKKVCWDRWCINRQIFCQDFDDFDARN